MTSAFKDGVLRCPLITTLDPIMVYDLPIVLMDWAPTPPSPKVLELIGNWFGMPLTYEPPRRCIGHEHPARITGFWCAAKNIEFESQMYLTAARYGFNMHLEMEFEDRRNRWLPPPTSLGHRCFPT